MQINYYYYYYYYYNIPTVQDCICWRPICLTQTATRIGHVTFCFLMRDVWLFLLSYLLISITTTDRYVRWWRWSGRRDWFADRHFAALHAHSMKSRSYREISPQLETRMTSWPRAVPPLPAEQSYRTQSCLGPHTLGLTRPTDCSDVPRCSPEDSLDQRRWTSCRGRSLGDEVPRRTRRLERCEGASRRRRGWTWPVQNTVHHMLLSRSAWRQTKYFCRTRKSKLQSFFTNLMKLTNFHSLKEILNLLACQSFTTNASIFMWKI